LLLRITSRPLTFGSLVGGSALAGSGDGAGARRARWSGRASVARVGLGELGDVERAVGLAAQVEVEPVDDGLADRVVAAEHVDEREFGGERRELEDRLPRRVEHAHAARRQAARPAERPAGHLDAAVQVLVHLAEHERTAPRRCWRSSGEEHEQADEQQRTSGTFTHHGTRRRRRFGRGLPSPAEIAGVTGDAPGSPAGAAPGSPGSSGSFGGRSSGDAGRLDSLMG
jgi:hypothetical protein